VLRWQNSTTPGTVLWLFCRLKLKFEVKPDQFGGDCYPARHAVKSSRTLLNGGVKVSELSWGARLTTLHPIPYTLHHYTTLSFHTCCSAGCLFPPPGQPLSLLLSHQPVLRATTHTTPPPGLLLYLHHSTTTCSAGTFDYEIVHSTVGVQGTLMGPGLGWNWG
jgi:hypothetical protein